MRQRIHDQKSDRVCVEELAASGL